MHPMRTAVRLHLTLGVSSHSLSLFPFIMFAPLCLGLKFQGFLGKLKVVSSYRKKNPASISFWANQNAPSGYSGPPSLESYPCLVRLDLSETQNLLPVPIHHSWVAEKGEYRNVWLKFFNLQIYILGLIHGSERENSRSSQRRICS